MNNDNQKKAIGRYASEIVKDGQVLGMGTGSTVTYFAKYLGERIKNGEEFYAVPTSYQSINLCQENRIKITTLDENIPEMAFDGADEVDKSNFLIKGRGGAMLQEKIVDYCSKEFYVMIDKSKLVDTLGTRSPVPVEVMPKAIRPVMNTLSVYGAPSIRPAVKKDGPIISDNGNFIVDLKMRLVDPIKIESELNNIPGIVENGIFTKKCKVLVAINDDVIDIK